MNMIKLTPRASQTALVLVALATLVAGCGSSSSSSSSSSSTSASTGSGSSTGRAALAACLKQHGITLPAGRPGAGAPPGGAPGAGSGNPPAGAPGSGSGNPPAGGPPSGFPGGAGNNSKFRAALKACGANFPAGGRRGGFNRQNIQKYVTCVRQHGYNLPNPDFSGKGPVFPANIRTNKKFQSASKSCQTLLAPPQGGASGSSA
ncbi:MAG: hypothetical protein ACXVHB_24510 [Solirubrobacteraceae bacterium]